jgi:hypothetical protein
MNIASPLNSFVEKMKQQATYMNKTPSVGQAKSLYTTPLYSRYIGNTGLGADNRLQPQNPAAIMNTAQGQRALHEGEDIYQRPGGAVTVIPAEQSIMPVRGAMARQAAKMPGYQTGTAGVMPRRGGGPPPDLFQAGKSDGTTPNDLYNIMNPSQQSSGSYQPNITGAATSEDLINLMKPKPTQTVPPKTYSSQPIQLAATNQPQQEQTVGATTQTQTQPAVAAPGQIAAPTAKVPATTTTQQTQGAATQKVEPQQLYASKFDPYSYYGKALGQLGEYMTGGSPYLKAIQDKYLQDLKAEQGVSQRMAGFEAAQKGVAPEVAAARQAMGRAVSGAQLAGAEAQMAGSEMQQMEQAAKDVANVGMAGAQFEQGVKQADIAKEQWEKSFAETQAQNKIANGWNAISKLMALDPQLNPATIGEIQKIAGGMGITFDGAALSSAGLQSKFNNGMDIIAKGIASGMSVSDIKNSLGYVGLSDVMNTAFPGGLDTLISNLSQNPIDKEWTAIEGSQMYQTLDPKTKSQFKTLWTAVKLGGDTGLVSVDENGNITINSEKVGKQPGVGKTTGQGGVEINLPADTKTGDYFFGEDNNLWINQGGKPVSASLNDLLSTKDWNRLTELGKKDKFGANWQALIKNVPDAKYTLVNKTGTDKISTDLREGDITKIMVNGAPVAVKVHRVGKVDKSKKHGALFGLSTESFDGAFIEFVDASGKHYYQETDGNLMEGEPKDGLYDNIEKKYVGGNLNIEGG